MNQDVEFDEYVGTLRFQLEHEDLEAKDELLRKIDELISNIPGRFKAKDENTMVTLRMFTRRC